MATTACSGCARPVPAEARFCPACGTSVGHATIGVEERRVVTVLFADLVGYTSIAEHRDPEQVKRLVESCFKPLVADIEALGGRVDKLLGDAIVALFGAPVAHEDDADRAVRAALRMHETLTRFVSQHVSADGPEIRMRIGINTGEVLVGTLAGSDYTATGDVVNTASRLQALAPPGGILIGAATEALCSEAISREPFGVTELRGRQQIEQPWLVTGASGASGRPLRCDVPFVGRLHEQAILESAIGLVANGHSGIVSITGEAGAGKSRLADEIVTTLGESAIVVQTACAPYDETSLWSPIRAALTSLLGLQPETEPADVRAAAERRSQELWSLDPGDEHLEQFLGVVNHLFGHPSELDELDPATAHGRVTTVLTDMIRRHAQTRMTVLTVDNLQWADPVVRDLLAVVVRSLSDLPFLLITTQRPDEELGWPPAELDRPLILRVPLGPLGREDSATLVRTMLSAGEHDASDERLVNDLVDRAGGNPLYLVELAALAECCGPRIALPGSLRALIAARLDQLPSSRRAIVDNAAVLGPNGSTVALSKFAASMHQELIESDLAELAADGILDLDGHWWRFRSDVVREVAYETLTKRTRAQRHAGVAAAIAAEKGHMVEDLAHHAATAAELVAELGHVPGVSRSISDRAVTALRAAAHEAMESGRADQAARHATRALDLHHADGAAERDLLLVRASAALDQRRLPAAHADGQRALDSAIADGDRVDEGEARRRLGTVATMQGDLLAGRPDLDQAVVIFRELGERRRLAHALRARGFAEVFGGSLPTARQHLGEAMAEFEELGDRRGQAWIRHHLAWVAFQSGDFATAQSELATSKQHFEKLGDRVGVNWADGLRAYVTYFQRHFDEAEALAVSVIGDAKRWGDTWATLMMQTLLANMRLWSGRLPEAEQLAERALSGFREAGDRYGVMSALSPLNRARAGLGKHTDARRGAEEAVSLGTSFGELGLAVQGAAGTAMHVGDGSQALLLADQVIDRNRQMGASDAEAIVIKAVALCQLGRADEAASAIEELEVTDFPFGRSARAVVRALNGDAEGADSDAVAVEEIGGASYFDLALARFGGVLAALHSGDTAKRRHWFGELRSLATSVGDVTFLGISQALAREPAKVSVALGDGWRTIVDTPAA